MSPVQNMGNMRCYLELGTRHTITMLSSTAEGPVLLKLASSSMRASVHGTCGVHV